MDVLDRWYYVCAIEWLGILTDCWSWKYDWSKWETYTKNYCEYLWWKRRQESWKYKCYLNGTTKQDYCEKTQWWTRINNKCYQNKQTLTCPGWIIQNNTCYSNQATCSTIQNNICYSESEPLYCWWTILWKICYWNSVTCNNYLSNICYSEKESCWNHVNNSCYWNKTECKNYYNGHCYSDKQSFCSTVITISSCKGCAEQEKISNTVYNCYKNKQSCEYAESNGCYNNIKICNIIEWNYCYRNWSDCPIYNWWYCYSNPTNLETECANRWWIQLIIDGSNINCYKSNTPCTLINNWICYTSENNLKSSCEENEWWYFTWKNGQYYCYKNVLQSLETYCSSINWTMIDNVCYGDNTTLDTNHNWFMWYACILYWEHESRNVKRESQWSNRGCYSNDSPCRDYKCVKENPTNTYTDAMCTNKFGADRIVLKNNNNSTTKRCEYSEFADCIRWDTKNIYKDYTYWCDLSITSQSSMILNIIDNIWKFSSSIWSNRWCGFRILWFCVW